MQSAASAVAPARTLTTRSIRVPITEAASYQDEGEWHDNPLADEHGQPPLLFRASYAVHYRPNGLVTEDHQYAVITSAT